MKLGERIKQLRKEKDLTLEELSALCGAGKATLSRIENDVTTGNLNTHLKICEALQVNLGELYKGLETTEEKVTAFDNKNIQNAEVFNYESGVSSVILAKQTGRRKMMPQLLIIEPQKNTPVEENSLGTDKFIYCLRGQVEVTIAERKNILKKNSTVYFDASLPHTFKNTGKSTARLIVVVSPVAL